MSDPEKFTVPGQSRTAFSVLPPPRPGRLPCPPASWAAPRGTRCRRAGRTWRCSLRTVGHQRSLGRPRLAGTPGLSMTKAFTFCIFSGSGTPMTQLICTSSWASRHVLQLRGVDVVAAGDDHALDAAAGSRRSRPASIEPRSPVWTQVRPSAWALEGLSRLLGVVEVAQHHRRAGQADLALAARREPPPGCPCSTIL